MFLRKTLTWRDKTTKDSEQRVPPVMPAWIAGIQVRRMRPETSMSVWIPALLAGMTKSNGTACTDISSPPKLRGDLFHSFGGIEGDSFSGEP
jgi:hypothetical protein